MDKNNQLKIVALGVCLLLGVLIIGKIFLRTATKATSKPVVTSSPGSNYTKVPQNRETTYTPASAISNSAQVHEKEAFIEEMEKTLEERLEEVEKQKAVWLQRMIDDEKLATQTREVYRLRSIKELKVAHAAMNRGDYSTAMDEFNKALADPKASPVTHYLTLDYMLDIARKTKDYDLYFKLWREKATLVKDEDLSVLKLAKNDAQIKFVIYQELLFNVSNTPGGIEQLVEKGSNGNAEKAKNLEKQYRTDIKVLWERLNGKL